MLLYIVIYIAALCGVGYFTERADSIQLLSLFGVAFGVYLYLTFKAKNNTAPSFLSNYKFLLIIGIAIRVILVFALPTLSDDFYRFIWDGRLLHHGLHPFLELPSYYMKNGLYSDFLTPDLYQHLNSKNYFTVYPPVLQGVFWLATFLFPNSVLGSVIIMKLVLLFCEIGSILLIIKLLQHFNLPQRNVLIYALNPVVILEIVGNIHFEGVLIFGSLLAVWLLVRQRWASSAAAMSVAIAAKLLPLMFLPFLIKRLKWKSIRYYLVVGVAVILLFSPLLNKDFLLNISESIGLYFRSFEYNGSIYYLLRWVGFQIEGYNIIAYLSPWLALTVAISVFVLAFRVQEKGFRFLPQNMLFALTIFYFLSTTVHPWYITSMVAFAALTRFRYPVAWSGLIFLTYINYGYEPFRENIGVVVLEYVLVFGLFIFEISRQRGIDIR